MQNRWNCYQQAHAQQLKLHSLFSAFCTTFSWFNAPSVHIETLKRPWWEFILRRFDFVVPRCISDMFRVISTTLVHAGNNAENIIQAQSYASSVEIASSCREAPLYMAHYIDRQQAGSPSFSSQIPIHGVGSCEWVLVRDWGCTFTAVGADMNAYVPFGVSVAVLCVHISQI